jgi:hypothetical protein
MSAPQTDIEKQAQRHRGPLRGMFAVVLFALLLLGFLAFWAFGRGGTPEGAATQVEGSTGETEAVGDGDAVSANDSAAEEADAATASPEADPAAVTVPSETVQAPQSGQSDDINPDTGGSDAAEPLNPVEDTNADGQTDAQ